MSDDLTRSMAVPGAAGAAPQRDRALPETVGPYRILSLIGEGGMGAVYSAEQQQPRRVVALKVIRAGIAGPEMLRRFELEAQVLGRLHHPGIAQIYEAGTADTGFGPQPWFAMEFIEGLPLNRYAEERRLGVRERLALMAKVCDGVHHAHQRGIIHRDLKPGNILVDESGQPKILDFGVARVTDSDAQATRQTDMGQLIGTLAYMSPEQVLADPLEIDTRSDVYSLGVILYQLLSGELPYNVRKRLLHEVVQTIREEEPRSLRTVNRLYRGDVETIVAKALEKDKTRRYASANGLAADLRRYLADEPIVARPATRAYQLQKFVRRHRGLVGAIAAVFVVLVAGVVASTWQAIRARSAESAAVAERARATVERDRAVGAEKDARAERDRAVTAEALATEERDRAVEAQRRADRERAVARAVNAFLQQDLLSQAGSLEQANANVKPDPDIKVRTVLDRAAAKVGSRFDSQPEVRAEIEKTIALTYEDLGALPEAMRHLESSLEAVKRVSGADSPEGLKIRQEIGGLYRMQGKYTEARAVLEPVVARYGSSRSADSLAASEYLAMVYSYLSDFPRAEGLYRRLLEASTDAKGVSVGLREQVLTGLAGLYFRQRKYAEAEPILLQLAESRRTRLGMDARQTVSVLNNLGVLYQAQGRLEKALPMLEQVLAAYRRILGEEHADTLNAMNNVAVLYVSTGRDAEAEAIYVRTLASLRKSLGVEHPRVAITMLNLGRLYTAEGKGVEAERVLSELLAVGQRSRGENHPDTLQAAYALSVEYLERGRLADAERLGASTLAARRRVLKPGDPDLARSMITLGAVRLRQGRLDDAESLAREAQGVLRGRESDSFEAHRANALTGNVLAARGRFAEAESLLTASHAGMLRTALGTLHQTWAREVAGKIAEVAAAQGKSAPAEERRARGRQ